MSHPHGPKSIAVLNHLAKVGPKNRLEMEREWGMAQLAQHIEKLRRGAYVVSLPKDRGELVKYQITADGKKVIGAYIQKQESLRYRPISELPPYIPTESFVRAGAMLAYQLPSRGMR